MSILGKFREAFGNKDSQQPQSEEQRSSGLISSSKWTYFDTIYSMARAQYASRVLRRSGKEVKVEEDIKNGKTVYKIYYKD